VVKNIFSAASEFYVIY